jgi:hypothetical protein
MRATSVAGKQGTSFGQTLLERDHVAVSPRAGSVSTIGPLLVIPILTSGTFSVTIPRSRRWFNSAEDLSVLLHGYGRTAGTCCNVRSTIKRH